MRQAETDIKKSRYSESQTVKILKEVEGGRLFKEVCREYASLRYPHPTHSTIAFNNASRAS